MLFVDLENFKKSLEKLKREPKFDNMSHAIFNYVVKSHDWGKFNPRLIRAYAYTGTYTDNLIKRLKQKSKYAKDDNFEKILEHTEQQYAKQKQILNSHNKFLEFRTNPLKYEHNNIFQKGVDVRLAVDLVSHAHMNNFDVAVLCSGDLDLLESVRAVKNLGKKVVTMSHHENIAYKMKREADSFVNLSEIDEGELDTFSTPMTKSDSF